MKKAEARSATPTILTRVVVGAVLAVALAAASAAAAPKSSSHHEPHADPAWSPDGRRIAFVKQRRTPSGTFGALYVMNPDGSRVQRLTSDVQSPGSPTWSPDSRRIAFVFYPRRSTTGPTIHVIGADGRGLRKLGFGSYPDWSPGGRKIAFNGSTLDSDVGDVFVMNPDGSGRRMVAASDGETAYVWPTWSPDGERLAFVEVDAPDTGGETVPRLVYVSDYSSGRVRRLVRAATADPDWSPDGRTIVYRFWPDDREPSVRVLDLRTQRTSFLHDGYRARWSPDGHQIVFTDGGQIHVMNADGSNVRQLTK